MREQIQLLLSLPLKDKKAIKQLESLGIDTENIDNQMAMVIAMWQTALKGGKGSVAAATFLRDTVGEKPIEEVSQTLNGSITTNQKNAIDDVLPRNSESRAISQSIKLIKKNAPHIKWIISFADGCQCGDGTIYRASNFVLTDIRKNEALRINPKTGEKVHVITAHHNKITDFRKWQPIDGYQLRYIYFIDKSYKDKLTVPIIPFSKINEMGTGMYKGKKR